MAIAWEETLAAFNPKGTGTVTLTKRTDVAGDQTTPWISRVDFTVEASYFDPAKDLLPNDTTQRAGVNGGHPDVWWAMNFLNGTEPGHFLVVAHIDYDKWGNKLDGPLSKFNHQGELILDPILPDLTLRDATTLEWSEGALKGNDTIDPRSLLAAADGIDRVVSWLTKQAKAARDWADKIDGPDSGWQGNAAGEFKMLLDRFAVELDGLRFQLQGANYGPYLKYAAQSIGIAINAVRQAQTAWYNAGFPYQCIEEVFRTYMAQRAFTWTTETGWDYKTALGDPKNDNEGFRMALDKAAKKLWLEKVRTMLDGPGDDALAKLGTAYAPLIAKLGPGLLPVGMKLPPAPVPDPNDSGAPPPGSGGGAGGGGTGGNGDLGLGDGNPDLGAGGGGGGQSGSKPPPLPPPPVIGPPGTGTTGGGTGGGGTGAGTPIRDKDGNVLLDKDKKPILLPPGGYIGAGGKVYDANGKEVLGTDGKPIVVPQGASVPPGTGGGIYGPNAKVPKGSTVREDGTVVDAEGKPVLDADGNPYVLEKGGSIAEDGTLLGADKKPISDYAQRSNDLRHTWNSTGSGGTGGGLRPPPVDTGSGGWNLDLGDFGSGSGQASGGATFGAFPGLFGGAGVGGVSVPTFSGGGSGPRILGTSSGFTAGAVENSGMVPGSKAATAAAAEAAAAKEAAMSQKASALAQEEAAMRGRSVSTSGGGMPMMPPMGGMGGGMGAGQGEKDRQRTTWLAEDEEVWGTETGAVDGVIGR